MPSLLNHLSLIKLIFLLLLWYATSTFANLISKRLLTIFPYPFTITFIQLFHGWIYSIPLIYFMKIPSPIYLYSTRIYYLTMILPLAIGKFLSQFTSQISLRLVPISYTHTVKALMPLFTVILSRIVFAEIHSIKIYLSLLPIIIGVVIASMSELSFDIIGLISALFSTFLLAIQNIFSKKILNYVDIHHIVLLAILSKLSWCLLIPFWFLFDGPKINFEEELTVTVIVLLLLDGFCNFIYNVLAFSLISYLSPLSYAIAGSTKRLVVITISILVLHNPITKINLLGIGLALIGVIVYNQMKYDEQKQKLVVKQANKHDILPSPLP